MGSILVASSHVSLPRRGAAKPRAGPTIIIKPNRRYYLLFQRFCAGDTWTVAWAGKDKDQLEKAASVCKRNSPIPIQLHAGIIDLPS